MSGKYSPDCVAVGWERIVIWKKKCSKVIKNKMEIYYQILFTQCVELMAQWHKNKLILYPTTIWPGHVSDSSQVNSIINIANSYM